MSDLRFTDITQYTNVTIDDERLKFLEFQENECRSRLEILRALNLLQGDVSIDEAMNMIAEELSEKELRDAITDKLLEFSDEIVSIEYVGVQETVDITVSCDNLFYANDILTKNSAGITFTADMVFAFIRSPELDKMGQILIKQLKSRYDDINNMLKFIIGIDMKAFTLHDVEGNLPPENFNDDTGPINSFGKSEKPKEDNSPTWIFQEDRPRLF